MSNTKHYLCDRGVPMSAQILTRKPTDEELSALAALGKELATHGETFRRNVRCPVNGDGYWYTRRELLDSNGYLVGSYEVDDGPRGEL